MFYFPGRFFPCSDSSRRAIDPTLIGTLTWFLALFRSHTSISFVGSRFPFLLSRPCFSLAPSLRAAPSIQLLSTLYRDSWPRMWGTLPEGDSSMCPSSRSHTLMTPTRTLSDIRPSVSIHAYTIVPISRARSARSHRLSQASTTSKSPEDRGGYVHRYRVLCIRQVSSPRSSDTFGIAWTGLWVRLIAKASSDGRSFRMWVGRGRHPCEMPIKGVVLPRWRRPRISFGSNSRTSDTRDLGVKRKKNME